MGEMTNYYKIIDGLDRIESPQLRDNIIRMYSELTRGDYFNGFNPEKIIDSRTNITKYLYRWVLGVGFPISASDYNIISSEVPKFEIQIAIDYKVFSLYKPYQEDDYIRLKFTISKNTIRDLLITNICE
jgi:hypothetical protein